MPVSGTYLCQELLYRSESCRIMLRRTAPYGPPRLAIQARPLYRRPCLNSFIACRSTWQLSSAPSPPVQSEFHGKDAKQGMHTPSEGEPMFCMQLPFCSKVPRPNCVEENPLSKLLYMQFQRYADPKPNYL